VFSAGLKKKKVVISDLPRKGIAVERTMRFKKWVFGCLGNYGVFMECKK